MLDFSCLKSYSNLWHKHYKVESFCLREDSLACHLPFIFNGEKIHSVDLARIKPTAEDLNIIEKIAKDKKAKQIKFAASVDDSPQRTLKEIGYNIDFKSADFVIDLRQFRDFDDYVEHGIEHRRRRRYYKLFNKKINIIKATEEDFGLLWDVYKETMEYRGAKQVLKKSFFLDMLKSPEAKKFLFLAEAEGKNMGACILIGFDVVLYAWFILARPQFRRMRVADVLYGHCVKTAIEQGYKYINFGPAFPCAPEAQIKKEFGAVAHAYIIAVKDFTILGKIKTFFKGQALKIFNRFPYFWRFVK